ncbi:MAG: aminotransferase class I/II-fold pyridoxal phosphate-dependent enzyme [Anaerolineales bacterium]|nr:aminotransferase class I/II-fold pyridoxal phosphate-dependent enzyme [Anaerolineales bacterium]
MPQNVKTTNFDVTTCGISTASVHAGTQKSRPNHALVDPIFQTSNFTFEDTKEVCDFMTARENGKSNGRQEYARYGNPTVLAAEKRIACLENGEEAVIFASGMTAITQTLLTFLRSGDHVILTDDCYRKTREFVLDYLSRFQIEATVVPMGDYGNMESAVRTNTRILFSETPTNPYLRILDLKKFSAIAKKHGLISMVDATFSTPCNQRPLDFGVDLVLHSATKYLGGHNDLLAGVVVGRTELTSQIKDLRNMTGPVSDPQTAFLLLRGIKTLGLRIRHQNQSALALANFLEQHHAVDKVWYPGLSSHPDYAVAVEQMEGFGGVVSFTIRGDLQTASNFIDGLHIPFLTPSLGGTESLVTQPAIMSYFPYTSEQRDAIGIKDNLVRYAVGVEDVEDLIEDIAQALEKISVGLAQ